MRRSEIFESFVKIAQEKGMISENAPEKAQKILEKTRRADSLTIEQIAKLYDVKPDLPADMKYTRNIVEDAHPESFVIAPSYDKLHGLVENVNERQDIILHILDKVPDGQLPQRKYAEQDLIMSLVRIGNDLDAQDQIALCTLADTCLEQLTQKTITKTAQVVLIGAAALLGALYAKQHLPFIQEGFEKDHQKLVAEIDDLLESSSTLGVGVDYKTDFINMLNDFKNRLNEFCNLEKQVEPILDQLQVPRDAQELMQAASHPDTHNVINAFKTFRAAAAKFGPYLRKIQQDFSSEMYKQRQIADKGFFTSLIDKTQILHGGGCLVADDFDDVRHAISPYIKDIADILNVLRGADSVEQSAAQELQQNAATDAKEFGVPTETAAEPTGKQEEGFKSQLDELEKHLSGGGFTP